MMRGLQALELCSLGLQQAWIPYLVYFSIFLTEFGSGFY